MHFQVAPHQKAACALIVSLMLISGPLCSGDGFFVFLYMDAHGSFIHNNPKLETEMSICRGMEKQTGLTIRWIFTILKEERG